MIYNLGKLLFLAYTSMLIMTLMDGGEGPVVRADQPKTGFFDKMFGSGGSPKPKEENKKTKEMKEAKKKNAAGNAPKNSTSSEVPPLPQQ